MPQLKPTLKGKALVLTGNAEEVFVPSDLLDSTDLRNLVGRIPQLTPFAPDVILLQEVNGKVASKFAAYLKSLLGLSYRVVVAHPNHAAYWTPKVQRMRDTAIIINDATMRAVDAGGFLPTKYEIKDVPTGGQNLTLEHAHLLVERKDGSFRLAVASVHFVHHAEEPEGTVGEEYKRRWLEAVDSALKKYYGRQTNISVIAGDLNLERTADKVEKIASPVRSFWDSMTRVRGYSDAILAANNTDKALKEQYRKGDRYGNKRLDYMFVKGARVEAASHDVDYGAEPGDPTYASDHRLLYALLGKAQA